MTITAPDTDRPDVEAPVPEKLDACLAEVLSAAMALQGRELEAMNGVDVCYATGMVLGSIARLTTLLPGMRAAPGFDVRCLRDVQVQARALLWAHSAWAAFNSPLDLGAPRAEAIALRKGLLSDAAALRSFKLLPPRMFANLSHGTGDRELASDLLALCAGYRSKREAWAGKSCVTREELARAGALAGLFLRSVGARVAGRTDRTRELAALRQRVYTLFRRSYDQLCRVVVFLRWKAGDADAYAPSLFEAHPHKQGAADESAAGEAAPGAPSPVEEQG